MSGVKLLLKGIFGSGEDISVIELPKNAKLDQTNLCTERLARRRIAPFHKDEDEDTFARPVRTHFDMV